jgi:ABC-2 type transport system ATP-binding protein
MNEISLKLSALGKSYMRVAVLSSVDLTLKSCRIYALVGAHGSGKTTLFRILTGLVSHDSGEIEMLGMTGKALKNARKRIGAIVDIPTYSNQLSIYQNMVAQSMTLGKVDRKRIDRLLKAMNITKDITGRRKMANCMTGIRQNFAIASAFLGRPSLLLLDEVFTGLDNDSAALFEKLLHEEMAERDMTVLMSGQFLSDFLTLATDFIFIDKGKIKAQYSRDELLEMLPEEPEVSEINILHDRLIKEAES